MSNDRKEENTKCPTVRVNGRYPFYRFAEVAKRLLTEGATEVVFSALGDITTTAIMAARKLVDREFCVISSVKTDYVKLDGYLRRLQPKLTITVKKSEKFDELYAEQKEKRATFKKNLDAEDEKEF